MHDYKLVCIINKTHCFYS